MNWTKQTAVEAANIIGTHRELGAALEHLTVYFGEPVTEGMLKGAFMRLGLGGVREKLYTPPPPPKATALREAAGAPPSARLYLVGSDIHVPYHDGVCWEAFCALASDLRPNGIVLDGDFLDLLELSRHSAGSLAKLEGKRVVHTFEAGRACIGQVRDAAGEQCDDNTLIDGNHEDRITRWLAAGDNAVFAGDPALDLAERLHLEQHGFRHVAGYPRASVDLGKLLITHGRFTNKFHAAKHLDYYRHSVMYGHTHIPQQFVAPCRHGQQIAIGLGHMADPDSEAMGYAPPPNAWIQGFGIVYVLPDGSFHASDVKFHRGQFAYAGRTYGRLRRGGR